MLCKYIWLREWIEVSERKYLYARHEGEKYEHLFDISIIINLCAIFLTNYFFFLYLRDECALVWVCVCAVTDRKCATKGDSSPILASSSDTASRVEFNCRRRTSHSRKIAGKGEKIIQFHAMITTRKGNKQSRIYFDDSTRSRIRSTYARCIHHAAPRRDRVYDVLYKF